MKNFIILFEEKEGTSPLVRLLDNFDDISVVHQTDNSGWEPFDRHNCGPMPLGVLLRCLDLIFGDRVQDMAALNALYTQTATRPLAPISPGDATGFKMRFRPPAPAPLWTPSIPGWNRLAKRLFGARQERAFHDAMKALLLRHGVFVFMAVRQDVLRWGLSKYHGSGDGKGHLQFKLASGQISRDEIGRIRVDCDRLGKIIEACEQSHEEKRELIREFEAAGIPCAPLRYEDFLADKPAYFRRLCRLIGLERTDTEVKAALAQGAYFEKVHSDDISSFVENHEEVMARFGDRFVRWG